MKLWFNLAFDGPVWPGPLGIWPGGPAAPRDAVVGEAWVGPQGLLWILETQLGLGGLHASNSLREVSLVPAILQTPGFWSQSAQKDPFAVAHTVLRWRDTLVLNGWTGEPPGKTQDTDRLTQLARVTQGILPGLPDRLVQLTKALAHPAPGRLDLERMTLLAQGRSELPLAWQRILRLLEEAGVTLTAQKLAPAEPAEPGSDLGRCRTLRQAPTRFSPQGDGSLQLVRAPGFFTAAEQVAAWLARQADAEGALATTLIVGSDPQLDAALADQGLPTTGAGTAAEGDGDPLLQVLNLALGLGWGPPDPQLVADLLLLPTCPVPGRVRSGLLAALDQWPAVGSDAWQSALTDGLDRVVDPSHRRSLGDRLRRLFSPATTEEHLPCADIIQRLDALAGWHHGSQEAARSVEATNEGGSTASDAPAELDEPHTLGPNSTRWHAAIAQSTALRRLIEACGLPALTPQQLRALVERARADTPQPERFPPQAGLAAVASPAAIAGPARQIVWWRFTRSAADSLWSLPLDRDEEARLHRLGVAMPAPAAQALALSEQWWRPLEQATHRVLLCCPRLDEESAECFPHPLWDEISATTSAEDITRIVPPAPKDCAPNRPLPIAPLPRAAAVWHLTTPTRIPRPATLSVTELGTLLGCPLAWVFERVVGLRSGRDGSLLEGTLLFGNLAHRILEQLLRRRQQAPVTPALAAEQAARIFDQEGPQLATTLFLPGSEPERARVRHGIEQGVRELITQLDEAGARVAAVEHPLRRQWQGVTLRGRVDLLTDHPRAVVDFKWSGARRRREELATGTAWQLAAYAYLASGRATDLTPLAYYIVSDQRLLTTDDAVFPRAEGVGGRTAPEIWQAVVQALTLSFQSFEAGEISCAGVEDEDGEVIADAYIDDQGRLILPAACRFCDFAGLCSCEVSHG